jgi:hypothetical protein
MATPADLPKTSSTSPFTSIPVEEEPLGSSSAIDLHPSLNTAIGGWTTDEVSTKAVDDISAGLLTAMSQHKQLQSGTIPIQPAAIAAGAEEKLEVIKGKGCYVGSSCFYLSVRPAVPKQYKWKRRRSVQTIDFLFFTFTDYAPPFTLNRIDRVQVKDNLDGGPRVSHHWYAHLVHYLSFPLFSLLKCLSTSTAATTALLIAKEAKDHQVPSTTLLYHLLAGFVKSAFEFFLINAVVSQQVKVLRGAEKVLEEKDTTASTRIETFCAFSSALCSSFSEL